MFDSISYWKNSNLYKSIVGLIKKERCYICCKTSSALATAELGNPDGDLVYADLTLGATITYI